MKDNRFFIRMGTFQERLTEKVHISELVSCSYAIALMIVMDGSRSEIVTEM